MPIAQAPVLDLATPNAPAGIVAFADQVADSRAPGWVRTKHGKQLLLIDPELLADLDIVLADPAFLNRLELSFSQASRGEGGLLSAPASPSSPIDSLRSDQRLFDRLRSATKEADEGRGGLI